MINFIIKLNIFKFYDYYIKKMNTRDFNDPVEKLRNRFTTNKFLKTIKNPQNFKNIQYVKVEDINPLIFNIQVTPNK